MAQNFGFNRNFRAPCTIFLHFYRGGEITATFPIENFRGYLDESFPKKYIASACGVLTPL